jgi:hypothetical protein
VSIACSVAVAGEVIMLEKPAHREGIRPMTTDQVIAVTGIVAVLITGGGIYVTLRGLRNQLWLTTFAEYTGRYSDITRRLPAESRRPGGDFDIEQLSETERGSILNAVREYMNLCSEEFYLHGRKKIDDETWSIWEVGMKETVRLPWIQETWTSIRAEYSSYPEFREFIDSFMPAEEAEAAL